MNAFRNETGYNKPRQPRGMHNLAMKILHLLMGILFQLLLLQKQKKKLKPKRHK